MMTRIAILGSTGSIGVNTLDVISRLTGEFEVIALSAESSAELLARQAGSFRPRIVCIGDKSQVRAVKDSVPKTTKVISGLSGLEEIAGRNDVDLVVFAIAGSSCIMPLVKAIRAHKRIALANKEAMVSAGSVIMDLAGRNKAKIVPIDSEHSAIFQCLEGQGGRSPARIYLTGSGGPLLGIKKGLFDKMSRKFVLRHPKWKMGRKISVDSATMMNKGLEIIEARWLFDIDESLIEVLIHPEAVIHSMVELTDGAVFAQMAVPDMRIPIQYALMYPSRGTGFSRRLDFSAVKNLSFKKPDLKKFPCLGFARNAIRSGGTFPAVLNSANEEAVGCYLSGAIKFSVIPKVIEKVLARHKGPSGKKPGLDEIMAAEAWAREEARSMCYH